MPPTITAPAAEVGEYSGYVGITKSEELSDGTLMVYGKVTGPDTDMDGQQCDPVWLKRVMPAWFKFANVREQHSNIAAGVGIELNEKDGSWYLKTHVVDPGTVLKVKRKVLKGYSIGVKGGKLLKTVQVPNGVIVDGDMAEVSLVDRPCLTSATIDIVKSVLGDLSAEAVEDQVDDDGGDEEFDDYPMRRPAAEEVADEDGDTLSDRLGLSKGLDGGELETVGDIRKGFVMDLLTGKNLPKDKDSKGGGQQRDDDGKFAAREAAKAAREKKAADRAAKRKAEATSDAAMAEKLTDAQRARTAGRGGEAAEHLTAAAGHARTNTQRRMVRDERGQTAAALVREKAASVDEIMDWVTDTETILGLDEGVLGAADYRTALGVLRDVSGGRIDKSAGTDTLEDSTVWLADLVSSEAEGLREGDGRAESALVLLKAAQALYALHGDGGEVVEEVDLTKASAGGDTLVDAGLIEKAVTEATAAMRTELAGLSAELARVKNTPIPGGPVIMSVPVTKAAAPDEGATKAAGLRAQASRITDPEIRAAYMAAAAAAEGGAS